MARATLTEETLVTHPSDPLWDQLSKIKGVLGVMGALNHAESTPIESEDLGWTLITLREIIEALENDLEKAGYPLGKRGEFHRAHHTSLGAQPTKDPSTVNGNPKGKAKVRKEG